TARIVRSLPHDPKAFTQGLSIVEGQLYEGTGLVGESSLRRVELASGKVLEKVPLPKPFFGEGIAVLGDEIFQLTWRDNKAFVYDRATLKKKREISYEGEGWGLASDGKELAMTDGTPRLRFVDPATFATVREVQVKNGSVPVRDLNELEYVKGQLLVNV